MAEESEEPIVRLDDIRRDYGDVVITHVLKGIDLEIGHGEFSALVGPSGSGKSTLLNIMGLLDRPNSGQVFVNGQATDELDDGGITRLRGGTLGFVFQFHHLLTGFSVLENVMMPAAVARGSFSSSMRERAERLLDEVELLEHETKNVRHLSGGQQQRVAIARALTNEPDLVLADEPTGNLDTTTADRVTDLLRRINTEMGTAFLIVTHEEARAERCDRFIRLVDGQIVEDRPGADSPRQSS